jgi:hypothetical protein
MYSDLYSHMGWFIQDMHFIAATSEHIPKAIVG